MEVWTQLEGYQFERRGPLILALGNFDGVHLGHQQVLRGVVAQAKTQHGVAGLLTFYEHPQRVLHGFKEPKLLTSPQHRLLFFDDLGLEVCFVLHFTVPFSKRSAEEFVEQDLVGKLGVAEVHMGANARFGSGRRGDGGLMQSLSETSGFRFVAERPVEIGSEFVSSSQIRRKVAEGNLEAAEKFLGRPFSIFASVVRGSGRGRKLGFPTANLQPHSEILPPRGVYPVRIRQNSFHLKPLVGRNGFRFERDAASRWYEGVLNYGYRPTFGGPSCDQVAEVFLFGFDGDLYGKTVEVVFYPKIRDEQTFQSVDELLQAVRKDVREAERYFQETG